MRPLRVRVGTLLRRVPGGWFTLTAILLLVLLLLVLRYVLQPFTIPTGSMEPGLRPGDRVLVNRLAYRFGATPQRGDVVVFDGTEYFGDGDYIKRVVGVGGDRVVCCDSGGRLEVSGRPLDETRYLYTGNAPSRAAFDIKVPKGRLFLLGDHRNVSSDSRDRLGAPGGGMLPVEAVIGKAEWSVWPPSRWDSVSRDVTAPELPLASDVAQAPWDVATALRDAAVPHEGPPGGGSEGTPQGGVLTPPRTGTAAPARTQMTSPGGGPRG